MIKQKNTLFLGVFLLIIWIFDGIPRSWKVFFTIISALYLVIISLKINLPKRGVVKRVKRKEKVTPVFVENYPQPVQPVEPIVDSAVNIENQVKF